MILEFQFKNDAITYKLRIDPEAIPKEQSSETRTAKQIFREEVKK